MRGIPFDADPDYYEDLEILLPDGLSLECIGQGEDVVIMDRYAFPSYDYLVRCAR